MSLSLDGASSGVNDFLIPISVCAKRVAGSNAIKSMYPKWIKWESLGWHMCNLPWSPSHFLENHRKLTNVITGRLVGFDFDSGLCSLDEMIDYLKMNETPCFVGTTKSHQIEKGDKEPCDRFRVAILMEREIADCDLYRQQMDMFKSLWRTGETCWFDASCVDMSRYFKPCKEIVYRQGGEPLPWVKKIERTPLTPIPPAHQRNAEFIPQWVRRRVAEKRDARHTGAYAVAACLVRYGWSLEEIVEYVMSGYIAEIGVEHVREACWYGFSKFRQIGGRGECLEFVRGHTAARRADEGKKGTARDSEACKL